MYAFKVELTEGLISATVFMLGDVSLEISKLNDLNKSFILMQV